MENLQQLRQRVDDYLTTALKNSADQADLLTAMDYSVAAGGKRLRPTLTLAVAQLLGVELTASVLKAACAVELLHTYSLIHDDLPAMDNDDLRRGKPTSHKQFGEAMAILAGDALQATAFEWVTDNELPVAMQAQLARELALASGARGMVAGQVRDILGTGHQLELAQLKHLHAQKTGALLRYAVLAGGIIAQATPAVLAELVKFGESYGLAFQIYDDILDATATSAELGKATHKDADRAKNTYVNLLGLAGAQAALHQTLAVARDSQAQLAQLTGTDTSTLTEFLAYFKED